MSKIFNTSNGQYIIEEMETPTGEFAGYKCSSRVEGSKYGKVYKHR